MIYVGIPLGVTIIDDTYSAIYRNNMELPVIPIKVGSQLFPRTSEREAHLKGNARCTVTQHTSNGTGH